MRYRLFICLVCLYFSSIMRADPFYPDEEKPEATKLASSEFTRKSFEISPCISQENINNLYLPLNFEQLKLVGIIKFKQGFRALFSNNKNQLFDLKINDYVVSAGIQIKQIDFKMVTLIDWTQTEICQNPYIIQLKI